VHEGLIQTLSLSLLVTSLAAVEMRRLRFAAGAYLLQALLIVSLLLNFAAINSALYWWAATALMTKAVLIPWFLWRAIGRTTDSELKPLIGFGPSIIFAATLMAAFYHLTHSHFALLVSTEFTQQEIFRTNLAVAATVFVLGLYCILTRREAIKTVIGLCLLENGVHLSLVSLAPELPETALFGVASETALTVFLLLYVIVGVWDKFGTTDTLSLRELQR